MVPRNLSISETFDPILESFMMSHEVNSLSLLSVRFSNEGLCICEYQTLPFVTPTSCCYEVNMFV